MVEFGVSVLKVISGNKNLTHFVLYNRDMRDHLLRSIIDRLPTDEQRQFIIDQYTTKYRHTIGKYTTKYGSTYPCISRSASGESTASIVVVYSRLVVVYSSLVCLQWQYCGFQHLSWYAPLHLA